MKDTEVGQYGDLEEEVHHSRALSGTYQEEMRLERE